MNDNAIELYNFCGENLHTPLSIEKLQKNIEFLEQHLYGLIEEIKANGPINIADQLRVPGIKFIKVGLTANKLEEQIKRIVVNADISNYISSPEDLKTIAQSTIGIYKKKGKKAIPEDIVRLCKGYLKGSVLKDEFAHQIYLFRLKDGQTKLEDLKNSMKKPTESSWQNTDELDDISNYSYDDPELMGWLAAGGNYGVVACPFKNGDEVLSNLVLIDLDDYDRINELKLLQGWPETFTVRTGRMAPEGRHFYYMVLDVPEDLKGKITLWEADHSLGEVKLNASQCVGPGSLHPSARRYEVVNPSDIAVISWEKIQELIDQCQSTSGKKIKTGQTDHDNGVSGKKSKKNSWEDQIRTEWILFPETIVKDERDGSGWVQGLSPIHPISKQGINLSINIKTNEWRCWVCEHSGGPLEALAVTEGLIPCDHITTGWRKQYPDVFKAVLQLAKGKWPDLVPEDALKPFIDVADRQLHEISQDALRAIVAANTPPKVFRRGRHLQRIVEIYDKNGFKRYALESFDERSLRGIMSRTARYGKKLESKKGGSYTVICDPPKAVVQDLITMDSWPGIPFMEAIVESPVVRPDGSILTEEGYDEATRLYYMAAPGLNMPEIPEKPTREDALNAAKWLLDEVLVDFRFLDEPSKANAMVAILTPIIRMAIPDVVPLALIDKPTPGTGATLLMDTISIIATGKPGEMMGQPESEEEWRKVITSNLMAGKTLMCFDNVDKRLRSAKLCQVLTAEDWSDRILGKSESVTVPNRATWMATGNNITLGGDVARRCYWIRMDAKMARPQTRKAFRHAEIKEWLKEHRGEVLAKILIMVRAWYAHGCPGPLEEIQGMGNFNRWAKTVGGILNHAGIMSVLANTSQLLDQADIEAKEWERFFQTWYNTFGDKGLTVSELYAALSQNSAFQDVIPGQIQQCFEGANERSTKTKLGGVLGRKREVRYPFYEGDLTIRLVSDQDKHRGVALYKVVKEV